jgi:hypothetical protein
MAGHFLVRANRSGDLIVSAQGRVTMQSSRRQRHVPSPVQLTVVACTLTRISPAFGLRDVADLEGVRRSVACIDRRFHGLTNDCCRTSWPSRKRRRVIREIL